jgi:hypothetical protein
MRERGILWGVDGGSVRLCWWRLLLVFVLAVARAGKGIGSGMERLNRPPMIESEGSYPYPQP